MSRKGENIYKRKDGRWEGRVAYESVESANMKYKSIYGKTYREVKEKMIQLRAQPVSKNTEFKINYTPELYLKEYAVLWIDEQKPHLKKSSYCKYQNQLNKSIIPYFEKMKIRDINNKCVQQFILNLQDIDTRKPLSPRSVRDTLSTLRRILNSAVSKGIECPCDFNGLRFPAISKRITVLSKAEEEKLISLLIDSSSLLDAGILLTLFSGLRIGELCALRWDKINLSKKWMRVDCSMQRIQNMTDNTEPKTQIIIAKPKSLSSVREIPLPEFIISYLKRHQCPENEFFLTGQKDYFLEPRTMQYHLHKILKNANLEIVNFHALRHTFATRCIENSFDIKSLSEILGHSSINITLNHYVHPSAELKMENMNRLETLFTVKDMVDKKTLQ